MHPGRDMVPHIVATEGDFDLLEQQDSYSGSGNNGVE
jgi:hypothetical protein